MAVPITPVEEAIKAGRLSDALAAAMNLVRENPQDSNLRVLLFQLLSACGDWERASKQLVVVSELSGRTSTLPIIYNRLIRLEVYRAAVFRGEKAPTIFGEPDPWVSLMIQSLAHLAKGENDAAFSLNQEALSQAPATRGRLNGHSFDWIADMDSRLGPLLEVYLDETYFWIPFRQIADIQMEPPSDLRHLVWAAANFTWANGGTANGFIPVRYPGAETSKDDLARLARHTSWDEPIAGFYLGQGQRSLATDQDEYPLLEIRSLELIHGQ